VTQVVAFDCASGSGTGRLPPGEYTAGVTLKNPSGVELAADPGFVLAVSATGGVLDLGHVTFSIERPALGEICTELGTRFCNRCSASCTEWTRTCCEGGGQCDRVTAGSDADIADCNRNFDSFACGLSHPPCLAVFRTL
jgi:hypothetical protein